VHVSRMIVRSRPCQRAISLHWCILIRKTGTTPIPLQLRSSKRGKRNRCLCWVADPSSTTGNNIDRRRAEFLCWCRLQWPEISRASYPVFFFRKNTWGFRTLVQDGVILFLYYNHVRCSLVHGRRMHCFGWASPSTVHLSISSCIPVWPANRE
jgi:hypothetical protein